MSGPNAKELIQFLNLLTEEAPKGYEPWLFRVETGSKAPDLTYGSWKDEDARLSKPEAVQWMESGGNVGIAGRPDDAPINVDIDDEDETSVDDLKPTLIARSRSRTGVHAWYFEAPGAEIPNIPTDDAGEVRANWQYVVAPGSYVETEPEEVPRNQREQAGYYTIERENAATSLRLNELPAVFREQDEPDPDEQEVDTPDPEFDPNSGDSTDGSSLFEISAADVVRQEGGGSTTSDERWASLFHGSDTGKNMSMSSQGRLHCWRHEVAHNGLQALAVLSDYNHNCAEIGTGHKHSGAGQSCLHREDGSHIWHAWKYAKQNGYLPDDDPVPYSALKHLCRERELCAVSEIPDDYDPDTSNGRLPAHAYDMAIRSIEEHDGLNPARPTTDELAGGGGESGENAAASDVTAADEAREETEASGGAAAADAPAAVSRRDGPAPEERATERILDRVIIPYDPPEDCDVESIDKQTAVHRAAEIYHEELAWLRPREDTRGWRSTLYNYVPEDGIYEPHGEAELERMLDSHFGPLADNQLVSQVIRKVERMARVSCRRLDEPAYELVVSNGILNLETGELSEHTPSKFHQTMVDIEYDPEADCPRVDDFLHDVVSDSDVSMLYRLIAHALYKEYEAEKAAMLLGDGQNGKSVFLSLVEQFLGEWNVSNQSLQKLNEDDWAANNLVGKLANVHPDMSDQTVSTMQMFKKLTGRDTIAADVKFEQPIRFENFATLIFACNRMPVLEDDTRGNWRRWILIDFPNTFERGDEDYVPKQELMAEVTAEEELQGLLTRCVNEVQRWADGEEWFPEAPHWKEARKQIRRAAEPIYDFTHACLERGDDYIEKEAVRHCYSAYAEAEGLPSMSREEFGRKIINQSDMAVEGVQKRVNGQRKHVYENIEFTSRGKQLLEDDPDTHTDSRQDSLGSRRARADRVVRLCLDIKDEHMDDGNVSHELLVGAAVQDGMQIDEAAAAIEKARREGDLAGTEESGYLPGV